MQANMIYPNQAVAGIFLQSTLTMWRQLHHVKKNAKTISTRQKLQLIITKAHDQQQIGWCSLVPACQTKSSVERLPNIRIISLTNHQLGTCLKNYINSNYS